MAVAVADIRIPASSLLASIAVSDEATTEDFDAADSCAGGFAAFFPCCAEFWELRPPASVEMLRRTNSPLCLTYSFDSISPGIAPGRGAFTEGMRFRFGYRSETSAVAGTVLKMRFITSVRSKL